MPLTIVGTVDTSAFCARFTVDGGTAPYRLQAFPTGRPAYTVRTMWTPHAPSGLDAIDGDIPFDTPTAYIVTDSLGAQAQLAGTLTVTAPGPVLSDATNPTAAVLVLVVSQPPNEWQARSVWWDILGAGAPFVSTAPMRYRHGDLVLRARDVDERDAVLRILASGNPFVLRSTCQDAVDDVIGLPNTVRDELTLESAAAGPRFLRIAYQAVARELGPYAGAAGRTYGIVLAESSTYAVVSSNFGSYSSWLAGIPL